MKSTWIYRDEKKGRGGGGDKGGSPCRLSVQYSRSRAERSPLYAARKHTARLALPILQRRWREALN